MFCLHQSLLKLGSFTAVCALTSFVLAQPAPEQSPEPPADPPPVEAPPEQAPGSESPADPPKQAPDVDAPEAPAENAPEQAPGSQAPAPPVAEEPGSAELPELRNQPQAPPPPSIAPSEPAPPTSGAAPARAPAPVSVPVGAPEPAPMASRPGEPAATNPANVWPTAPTTQDTGVEEMDEVASARTKSRWRLSRLLLDQSVTAQTLGVGQDYQSSNPTYDWTLSLLPRYYFIDEDRWSYAVLGNFSIAQELTNSDTTTGRGELDANDSQLALRYDRTLHKADGYQTRVGLLLPELTLPTSRASRNNGRILALGASLIPAQIASLSPGPLFENLIVAGLARYQHYFSQAQVPINSNLERPRTDVGGRAVISDQLSGSAFAKHELRLGAAGELAIHDRVVLAVDLQWRPTWNYQFDNEVEVCNLLTGCETVDGIDDPESYELVTVFASEVAVQIVDEMSLTVGYINLANQIGPDGERRNMFYSPNARFYLTATAFLSEIFEKQGSGDTGVPSTTIARKNASVSY